MCGACVGYVMGMCWLSYGHVLPMCWLCVAHVWCMCWACVCHVLDMFHHLYFYPYVIYCFFRMPSRITKKVHDNPRTQLTNSSAMYMSVTTQLRSKLIPNRPNTAQHHEFLNLYCFILSAPDQEDPFYKVFWIKGSSGFRGLLKQGSSRTGWWCLRHSEPFCIRQLVMRLCFLQQHGMRSVCRERKGTESRNEPFPPVRHER